MADTPGIADDDGTPNAVFAYRWLADDAAIGGATASTYTLTSGEQGKNVRWEISVRPSSDGTVTIALPATADCGAAGAICTADGRLELTVLGP